jgi:PPM family protein phosphatase
VYQARDGVVRQLTTDHTLRNLQVQRGQVDPRRACAGKSAITRALGLRATVEVDVVVAPLRAADRLLLCTDGLSDCFERSGAEALARLLALEPCEAGPAAIAHALRCGGKDNVTALFVELLA